MSWFSNYKYSWYETLAMNILWTGPIPRHISFVMDGNRRFAQSEHICKIEGHIKGFDKQSDCLRWCLDMVIKEVTTFAFSIENYKRSAEEVKALLDLSRVKFKRILQDSEKFREDGIRMRVIGNIALLPADLQELIAAGMLETKKNDRILLNVAFSYTSRDEITQAVEVVLQQGAELKSDDICERLVEECLYTRPSPPSDLLFRTSGETRISDFLMWQLTNAVFYFTKIMWPQLTIWNFFAGIFSYQRASLYLDPYKNCERIPLAEVVRSSNFYTNRVQGFLHRLDMYRKTLLLSLTNL